MLLINSYKNGSKSQYITSEVIEIMNYSNLKILLILLSLSIASLSYAGHYNTTSEKSSPAIEINGIQFTLNKQPFSFSGISFFNALYNPTFNKNEVERYNWLKKLNENGITVLRIWAEWNNSLGFIDACDSCIVYNHDGSLNPFYINRLKLLLDAAASLDMVIEYVFFSSESKGRKLTDEAADRAVMNVTNELIHYRNMVFQIWNEYDYRVADYYRIIKQIDPQRLVSNSPGGGGTLGNEEHNEMLDFLTPHTSRNGKHWEKVGEEISGLIKKYNKPVVDDEPARSGTRESEWLGGPRDETSPFDHILHIHSVWKAGGHPVYHHDMFQTGYGSSPVPPTGIPDPDFDPYHKIVFDFILQGSRYK